MSEEKMDANKEHPLNPRPSMGQYELPCGWIDGDGELHTSILVKEISGVEEELIAGRGEVLYRMNKVMANCLVEIGGRKGTIQIVNQLTVIDRYYLLIALRRASLGDAYRVEVQCPVCKAKQKAETDLSELPIKAMDDPMARELSGTTASGVSYTFHVMTGEDELWLAKAKKKLEAEANITLNMLARVDSYNGEEVHRDPGSRKRFIQSVRLLASLGIRDRHSIRRAIEKAEGDLDLDLEFECKECGHEWSRSLDVSDPDFFFPSEM